MINNSYCRGRGEPCPLYLSLWGEELKIDFRFKLNDIRLDILLQSKMTVLLHHISHSTININKTTFVIIKLSFQHNEHKKLEKDKVCFACNWCHYSKFHTRLMCVHPIAIHSLCMYRFDFRCTNNRGTTA